MEPAHQHRNQIADQFTRLRALNKAIMARMPNAP